VEESHEFGDLCPRPAQGGFGEITGTGNEPPVVGSPGARTPASESAQESDRCRVLKGEISSHSKMGALAYLFRVVKPRHEQSDGPGTDEARPPRIRGKLPGVSNWKGV